MKKVNGDVDQPTNRQTDRQGEYRAICLFRKLENRKKTEICKKRRRTERENGGSIWSVEEKKEWRRKRRKIFDKQRGTTE